MSGKSQMLLTKSAFHLAGDKFEGEPEKYGRSSFRIDDLLKKHSSPEELEHPLLHRYEQSSPSPSSSPQSSSISPTPNLSHHPFGIDALSLAALQHQRQQQQQILQSSIPCSYPYNPLLSKFGLNFMPTSNLFPHGMGDFLNPYHLYGRSTLDHLPFLLRDRLLHYDSSGSRKCRRSRTVFSELQLMALEKRFERQKYLSTPDRMELAEALGLTQLQVKTWYQNRRMKWKKQVQQCDSSNESEQEKTSNDNQLESPKFDARRENTSSTAIPLPSSQNPSFGDSNVPNDAPKRSGEPQDQYILPSKPSSHYVESRSTAEQGQNRIANSLYRM